MSRVVQVGARALRFDATAVQINNRYVLRAEIIINVAVHFLKQQLTRKINELQLMDVLRTM